MKLKSLHLGYWKGAIDEKINFQDKTNIYLENEGGKTRIPEAILWIFYGKHPKGKTDIDIKTRCTSRTKSHFPDNKIGDVIHNLSHSATLVIEHEGREIELKKTFKETWGTTAVILDRHLKTHTTKYELDGHKCAKKKYEEELSKIIDEKTFRMLTDPLYFSSDENSGGIHWSERRNILLSMGDEVDNSKIKGYEEIKDLIASWSPEEKKIDLKSEIKKIGEKKEEIPIAVKENQRHFIDIDDNGTLLSIDELNANKAEYQEKINSIKTDSGQQEIKNKISTIDNEILQKTTEFNTDKQKKIDTLVQQESTTKEAITSVNHQIELLKNENEEKQRVVDINESTMETERGNYKKIVTNKEALIKEVRIFDDKCYNPVCKKPLDPDVIEKSKEEYNLQKADILEEFTTALNKISVDGKLMKTATDSMELHIIGNTGKIEHKNKEIVNYKLSRDSKRIKIDELKETAPDLSELESKKSELEKKIGQNDAPDTSHYDNLIVEADNQINQINQRALDITKNKDYTARIEELEKLEKKLSQNQADLIGQLKKLELFIVACVESQAEAINSMFKIASFKMFEIQVNGGINNEFCETMKDGVHFKSVNSAGRVQVGVDIIKGLQKFYGLEMPIFVDNREGCTNIPEIGSQVISLYVSPKDVEMRVEYLP